MKSSFFLTTTFLILLSEDIIGQRKQPYLVKQITWTDIPFLALPSACQGAFFVVKMGVLKMAFRCLSRYAAQLELSGFYHFFEAFPLLNKNTRLLFAAIGRCLDWLAAGHFCGVGQLKIHSQIKSIIVLKLKNSPIGQETALCDY
ncbi:MAG: hypothetical protein R2788_25910 [Saprospiraceae bacterium]